MSEMITDAARRRLAQSLPLVQSHKDELTEGLEASLRPADPLSEAFGQSEVTAMTLIELLIDQAKEIVESGRVHPPADLVAHHQALDITSRHYSRFGDALMPLLVDTFGPRLPREVATAWIDAFWATIRAASVEREKVAA